MKKTPRISESEWQVMKVLWAKSPAPTTEVAEALEQGTGWKLKTVLTLLNRLVKKGALGYEKQGRAYYYYPKVEEADCVRAETRSFLQRVTGGSLKPLLAQFFHEGDLSQDDIEELKRMLDARTTDEKGEKQ